MPFAISTRNIWIRINRICNDGDFARCCKIYELLHTNGGPFYFIIRFGSRLWLHIARNCCPNKAIETNISRPCGNFYGCKPARHSVRHVFESQFFLENNFFDCRIVRIFNFDINFKNGSLLKTIRPFKFAPV